MKKVVILVDQLSQHGGIEKLVTLKANYWAKYFGYKVTIVSAEQKGKPIIYNLDPVVQCVDLGINYDRLKSYFSLKNFSLLVKNTYKMQCYLFKEKPDFVVVAPHIPMTYIMPFLIRGSTILVKEFHFTKFYSQHKNSLMKRVFQFLECKYDRLVVLNNEEKLFYNSINVTVIPNPVQIENPKAPLIGIEKRDLTAISVVRFAPVKRLELMIEIWGEFVKVNSQWKLLIYGDYKNDYGKYIKELVSKKKLNDKVIFKGETIDPLKEMSKTRVLLVTSEQESFGMTIIEAHSVGVPVISFNCPTGPRNILHDEKDGFLVDNGNVSAFVQSLKQFSDNEELQQELSKNALQNSARYQIQTVMQQWQTTIFNL